MTCDRSAPFPRVCGEGCLTRKPGVFIQSCKGCETSKGKKQLSAPCSPAWSEAQRQGRLLWELVRNAESPALDLLNWDLHLNKTPAGLHRC